jgi:hypothetical protein
MRQAYFPQFLSSMHFRKLRIEVAQQEAVKQHLSDSAMV